MDGIMTLRASNQVLCNVWSYDCYDMTLSFDVIQRRRMIHIYYILSIFRVCMFIFLVFLGYFFRILEAHFRHNFLKIPPPPPRGHYRFFFLHTRPLTIVFKLVYALFYKFYTERSTFSIKKCSVRFLSTKSYRHARSHLTPLGIRRKCPERVKIAKNLVGYARKNYLSARAAPTRMTDL